MINNIYTNTEGLDFQVVELEKIDKNFKKYFKVRFLKTGYIARNVRTDTIKTGRIRDKLNITQYGVGKIGYINTREHWKEYKLWLNMLSRCYNEKDKSFKFYGMKGVLVDSKWHRFDIFFNDIPMIEGYNKENHEAGKLFLDKDIKSDKDNKLYSLETCSFVSSIDNQKQRTKEYNLDKIKIAIYPNGHKEILTNVSDFCVINNLSRSNVVKCLNGTQKYHKGFKFYKEQMRESQSTIETVSQNELCESNGVEYL